MRTTDLTVTERLVCCVLHSKPSQTLDDLLKSTGLKWKSNLRDSVRYLLAARVIATDQTDGAERYSIAGGAR